MRRYGIIAGVVAGLCSVVALGMTIAEGSHEFINSPCAVFTAGLTTAGTSTVVQLQRAGVRGTTLECGKKYRQMVWGGPAYIGTSATSTQNGYFDVSQPEERAFCRDQSATTSTVYMTGISTTSTIQFCEFGYGR